MEASDYTLKDIYAFHTEMLRHEFTLVYEGEINHQITKAFTSMTEESMNKMSEDLSVKKKVFHVMVECLQNISKHAEETESPDDPKSHGIFIVGRNKDAYQIITGNLVDEKKKEDLIEILDKINSLNKDELKELYQKQLKDGALSDKGGAGLGFIDIARKTGQKLEYYFDPLTDGYYFFLLRTTIARVQIAAQ